MYRSFASFAPNFQFVEFRDLTDWSSIQSRLDSIGPSLSSAHIGAAYAQTQKLLPRPPKEFLDGLSRKTIDHLELLDIKTVSTVFHSCANMAYFDVELIHGLTQVVMEQIEFMDFKSLTKMIYNIGCLHQVWTQIPNNVQMRQFELLVHTLTSRITFNFCSRMFDFRTGSVLIFGLAKLKYKEPNLMRHLTQLYMRTSSRVKMECPEVASTLFGLSQLQFCDVTLIRHLGIEATRLELLRNFTNFELATTVYSLCRLGVRGKLIMQTLISEASKDWRVKGYSNQALCNILFTISTMGLDSKAFHKFLKEAVNEDRISIHSSLDLVTIVHALSKRPVQDHELLSLLLYQVTRKVHFSKFTARDLTILIFGFVQCGFYHSPELQPIIDRVKEESFIKQITIDQLARVVYSLGVLHEDLGDSIYAKLQMPFYLRSLSLSGVTRVVQGLASSRNQINSLNTICMNEALQSHRLALYSAKEVKCILHSLVKMDLKNSKFVNSIEDQIVDRNWYQKLSLHEVCDLVHPLALLNQRNHSPCLEALLGHLLEENTLLNIHTQYLITLISSCAEIGYPLTKWEMIIKELNKNERFESITCQSLNELIHPLSRVQYDGDLWNTMINKLKENLIRDQNPSLDSTSRILKSFGMNFKCLKMVLKKSRVIEDLIRSLEIESADNVAQLGTLASSLTSLSYKDPILLDSIGDQLTQREDFKSMEFIISLGKFVGACFNIDHVHKLSLNKIETHIKLLHETLMMDSSFPVDSYLTHELMTNFLNLKASKGELDPQVFGFCLDLMHGMEFRSIPLSEDQLRRIYLSFQCITFRSETSSQSRVLRRAMEAHISVQKRNEVSYRVHELLELMRNEFDASPHSGVVVEGADLWVDIVVNKRDRVVILFQQPRVDFDFHDDQETGTMLIKRAILEKHRYKVLFMKESDYDEMSVEEKVEWLKRDVCGDLLLHDTTIKLAENENSDA
eukprot:g7375.t1